MPRIIRFYSGAFDMPAC